jgi:hypothetical protein
MYREIVEKEGLKWEDCKVLAFEFDGPEGPEILHYGLMFPLRPVYHLFDRFGNVAYIVVPKDPENERMCIQLAESCGGSKTTPYLL